MNAVRLDSGDLLSISRKVRQILDDRGLDYVNIFASGDLDEYAIEKLVEEGANIDGFGVGTRMSTSLDRPYVDVVYKLSGKIQKGDFVPAMKLSKGKATLPCRKQIFRRRDRKGRYSEDIIGLEDEEIRGQRLLIETMKNGRITYELPSLEQIRAETRKNLSELPEEYKRLRGSSDYPIRLSGGLSKIRAQMVYRLGS